MMFTPSPFKDPFRYLGGQEGKHDVEEYFVDMATQGDSDMFRVSHPYTVTPIKKLECNGLATTTTTNNVDIFSRHIVRHSLRKRVRLMSKVKVTLMLLIIY